MRALVTGGAGFIGSTLVRHLLGLGWSVVVLDDLSRNGTLPRFVGAELSTGDIRDRRCVKKCIDGCDAVFHLAAMSSVSDSVRSPAECLSRNVSGFLSILDAALAARTPVVYASSAAVYGNRNTDCSEGDPLAPLSPYGVSKALDEAAALWAAGEGLPVVGLRLFNVYGPGASLSGEPSVIPAFLEAARKGIPPIIHGDGLQVRDFVHVTDVIAALFSAFFRARELSGRAINVASGEPTTIGGLWSLIARLASADESCLCLPSRRGDIRRSTADVGLMHSALGVKAAIPLEEGLFSLISPTGSQS